MRNEKSLDPDHGLMIEHKEQQDDMDGIDRQETFGQIRNDGIVPYSRIHACDECYDGVGHAGNRAVQVFVAAGIYIVPE